jgi:hypothetical protein
MLYLEGVESNRRNIMLRNNSMAVTFQGELVVPPIKTIFLSNSTFRIDEIENQIEELLLRKNRFRFFLIKKPEERRFFPFFLFLLVWYGLCSL